MKRRPAGFIFVRLISLGLQFAVLVPFTFCTRQVTNSTGCQGQKTAMYQPLTESEQSWFHLRLAMYLQDNPVQVALPLQTSMQQSGHGPPHDLQIDLYREKQMMVLPPGIKLSASNNPAIESNSDGVKSLKGEGRTLLFIAYYNSRIVRSRVPTSHGVRQGTLNFNRKALEYLDQGLVFASRKKKYSFADLFLAKFSLEEGRPVIHSVRMHSFTPMYQEDRLLSSADGRYQVIVSHIPQAFQVDKKHGPRPFFDSRTVLVQDMLRPVKRLALTHTKSDILSLAVQNNGTVCMDYTITYGRKPVPYTWKGGGPGFHNNSSLFLESLGPLPKTKQRSHVVFDKSGGEIPSTGLQLFHRSKLPGEGKWKESSHNGLHYQQTLYRPDPNRSHAVVTILKFKKGSYKLHLIPGSSEPKADPKGQKFSGRIPQSIPKKKLAFYFTGGFKTFHSPSGMQVGGQLIRKPRPGRAAIGIYRNGTILLRDWAQLPQKDSLESFRQNGPYILKNGRYNPFRRYTSYGLGYGLLVFTWRSALGQDSDGDLYYAIGNSLSHFTMARALRQAGASHAMMLEINAHFAMATKLRYSQGRLSHQKVDDRIPGTPKNINTVRPRDYILVQGLQP
jgi:hypothetical protein